MTMFVFGMLIAMLGTLFGLPAMRARLGIDLARQGDLFSVLFTGLLVAAAIVGPLLDRFGSKPVMVSASAMVAFGLAAFALARGFGAAAAAALLVGVGGGWLNTASNTLVSDVYPDERGRMLNLLGTFFGMGALFVPLVVVLGFEALSVTGILAIFAAVAGGDHRRVRRAAVPARRTKGPRSRWRGVLNAARSPGVLLFAVLLLFESGNETALSGWTSTYIGVMGWSPWVATLVLFGYWVVAILGRAASATGAGADRQGATGRRRVGPRRGGLRHPGGRRVLAARPGRGRVGRGAGLVRHLPDDARDRGRPVPSVRRNGVRPALHRREPRQHRLSLGDGPHLAVGRRPCRHGRAARRGDRCDGTRGSHRSSSQSGLTLANRGWRVSIGTDGCQSVHSVVNRSVRVPIDKPVYRLPNPSADRQARLPIDSPVYRFLGEAPDHGVTRNAMTWSVCAPPASARTRSR